MSEIQAPIQAKKSFIFIRLYFSEYLPAGTGNVIIKPNRFCYYVQKGHGFRENLVSVIVSTFLIFMFVDQLLLVDVFSQLYYLTDAKKQNNNVGLTVINR